MNIRIGFPYRIVIPAEKVYESRTTLVYNETPNHVYRHDGLTCWAVYEFDDMVRLRVNAPKNIRSRFHYDKEVTAPISYLEEINHIVYDSENELYFIPEEGKFLNKKEFEEYERA